MVVAQVFLNLAPLGACVFVTFFGRMFAELLRLLINFFIVVAPLLVSSLQEQLDGTTEVLTPVALMGSMWSVLAGVGVSYLCAKRPAFAKKIETVGVSFLCVLVLNSFYLGLLHGKVRHHAAAVVTYMEWLVPLATLLLSLALHFVRNLPGAGNWMDSFYMAIVGSFVGLQVLCNMEWEMTHGLSYKHLLNHDFGCTTTSCWITMGGFCVLVGFGTVCQFFLFHAGKEVVKEEHEQSDEAESKLKALLRDLINVNKAVGLLSTRYSAKEAEHMRVAVTEDIYKFLGAASDCVLLTFVVGLIVNVIEFFHLDLMQKLQARAQLTWCMMIVCTIAVLLTAGAWYLRLNKESISSSSWRRHNMMFLILTGIFWPLLIFSSFFVLTIGGEELAVMDVPMINDRYGFHKLPLGCDSHLPDDSPPSDGLNLGSLVSNTQRDTAYDVGGDADTQSWDGDHCYDGIWNIDEWGTDCGGSCNAACNPCQCSHIGVITNGSSVPFMGCQLQPDDNVTVGVASYHSVGGQTMTYQCFIMNSTGCEDSGTYDGQLLRGDWRYCNPMVNRDGVEYSSLQEAAHPELAAGTETAEVEEEQVTEVWYCVDAICYECTEPQCLAQCHYVRKLGNELPTMVSLMWGVTFMSLVSALTASGELGGLYLMVERLCVYLSVLNMVQGLALAGLAFAMGGARDGVEHLVEGDVSAWHAAMIAGVFLFFESLIGVLGAKFAGNAIGSVLWVYFAALVLTLLTFVVVFFAAAYYANNAHEYVEKHWDKYIYPELIRSNSTDIPEFRGVAHLSKDEFVEYARGSFRCLILAGIWIMGYMTALVVATKMTINRRHSENADFARSRIKGKGNFDNPMYTDMQVPIAGAED